jgi:hypothetical protein
MIKPYLAIFTLCLTILISHKGDGQIVITSVPHTISKSGTYTFNANLTYSGTASPVTITASDVTLDFAGHVLSDTNAATTTIAVHLAPSVNQNNVIIQNGTIQCQAQALAISADATSATYSAIVVQDMRLYAGTGVHIRGGTGCTIQRNLMSGGGGRSVIDLISSTGQNLIRDNQMSGDPSQAVVFNNAPSGNNSYFVNNVVFNGLTGFVFETNDKYRFNIADLCTTPYSSGIPLSGASN